MFGKIKDRLKNIFTKTEEIVEENPDEIVDEVVVEEPEKKPKTPKKSSPSKKKATEKETSEPEPKEDKKKENPEENILEEDIPEPESEVEENLSKEEEPIESSKEEEPKKKGMFGGMFTKKETESAKKSSEEETPEPEPKEEKGFFKKTFSKVAAKKITEDDFDKIWIELEIFLLEINIAYEIVEKIEISLREKLLNNSFNRFSLAKAIRTVLEQEVEKVLVQREGDFLSAVDSLNQEGPVKILVLGVNGTGKTTTIAKMVHFIHSNNRSCVVAAADTFRAAAVEQLDEHSKRLGFKLIQHKGGSDPAAVAFDAIEHAKAKNIDIVLIDTAGRMPNNSNLMTELLKVKRVSEADMAVFVGDSVSGNDLVDQIDLFNKGVTIDGVVLTKVDTDERPGSIVTTAYSIEKPIYFLGVGQQYEDLIKFDAKMIAEQLFSIEDDEEE